MTDGAKIRQMIDSKQIVLAIGGWDVLSAKIIKKAGFDMVGLQSFQVAAGFGLSDVGVLTPYELWGLTHRVKMGVDIPILIDFENGFGGFHQAAHWFRQFESAGVAMVHIDDMDGDLKCPWLPDANLRPVSAEVLIERIKAMVDVRRSDVLICARTFVWTWGGTAKEEEERLLQYVEAGADLMWAPRSALAAGDTETLKRLGEKAPIVAQSNVPGYLTTSPKHGTYIQNASFSQMQKDGISVFCCPQVYPVAYRALLESLQEVKSEGSLGPLSSKMLDHDSVLELLDPRLKF